MEIRLKIEFGELKPEKLIGVVGTPNHGTMNLGEMIIIVTMAIGIFAGLGFIGFEFKENEEDTGPKRIKRYCKYICATLVASSLVAIVIYSIVFMWSQFT